MISVDEARGRADRRRFTELPYLLFHDEPRWAAPLIGAEKARFDRWRNERVQVHLLARSRGAPAGRLGLELADDGTSASVTAFDIADDVAIAVALFAAAREWLADADATGAILGPDVLVDGFEARGALGRPWNPPWYAAGLRAAGLVERERRATWRLPAGGSVTVPADAGGELPAIAGRYADRRLVLRGIAAVPDLTEARGSARELLRRAKAQDWTTAVVVRCDGEPATLVPALCAAAGAAGYRDVIAPWSPDPDAVPEAVHASFAG